MSELITRFKQIRDDMSKVIDDWETKEKEVDSRAIDEVAVRSIKKQLSYLRRFYTDEEIVSKIGVKHRQFRRWEIGKCKPLPRNGWALKALYDEERRLHGEDV